MGHLKFSATAITLLAQLYLNSVNGQHVHTGDQQKSTGAVAFIENQGQWNDKVLFKSSIPGGSVFLEKNAFTYSILSAEDLEERHHLMHEDKAKLSAFAIHGHAWKVNFIGANDAAVVAGHEKRSEYHNYFIGNKPENWAGNVPLYNETYFTGVYDNIDLSVYSKEGNFKYDFIVKPHADASSIAMNYEGLDGLSIVNGNLVLQTSIGEVTELAPYAYQITDGHPTEVNCHFQLKGSRVTFEFPNGYNPSSELIIDPTVIASTYSGTTGTDNYGHCATYDNDGNIYTGAICFGDGYPVTTGAFQLSHGGGTDIAISKLNPTGTAILYATYVGGVDDDFPHSLVVSETDELYILGSSYSSDFPTSSTAYDATFNGNHDIVVTHLNTAGSLLVGSTYLGGTSGDGTNGTSYNYGDEYRGEIIVDGAGNAFIATSTNSSDFPITAGAYQNALGGGQDAVFLKLVPDLSALTWSTYYGGTDSDAGFGLRIDASGDIFGCGGTRSNDIPATGYLTSNQGAADGYIIHLVSDGTAIDASTYFGGTDDEFAFFINLDVAGDVHIYGQDAGAGMPITGGVYSVPGSGQFIASLDPTLTTLIYGTEVGGGTTGEFIPIAFLVDQCGFIYFSGHSAFSSLPVTADNFQTSGGFYLGVLDPEATGLFFATHYGVFGDHVDGGTSRFDPNGVVYQGVCNGGGFPTLPGSVAEVSGAGWDIAVFKIDFEANPLQAEAAASPSPTGCAPFTVDFENTSTGVDYVWDFDDGSPTTTTFEPSHTFTDPGVYVVMLVAHDATACVQYDTTYLTITVGTTITPTADFSYDSNCGTLTVTFSSTGTGGVVLDWDMGDGNSYNDSTFSHTYSTSGTYTVTLTAGDTICGTQDIISMDIFVSVAPLEVIFNAPTCYHFSDASITLNVSGATGGEVFIIEDALGAVVNVGGSNAANGLDSGWYYYYVDLGGGCVVEDSIFIPDPEPIDVDLTLIHPACFGDQTGIAVVDTVYNWQGAYDQITYFWNPDPAGVSGLGGDSSYAMADGTYTLTINDDNGCTQVIDIEIIEPEALSFAEIGYYPAFCRLFPYQSGNGVVYAAAQGGTADYSYVWTDLATGDVHLPSTWGGLNPGDYEIVITDDNGCILTQIVTLDSINPVADFIPESPNFTGPGAYEGTAVVCVEFTNTSTGFSNPYDPLTDTTFFWHYGYQGEAWKISHDFFEIMDTCYYSEGVYPVCLVAQNKNGCTDTTCKDMIIWDPSILHPVNVFTPDGDGVNDVFTFEFVSQSIQTFNAIIVDRWGLTIAEITEITQGWDGTDKSGSQSTDGVYFYTYTAEGKNGEKFEGQGIVTKLSSGKK